MPNHAARAIANEFLRRRGDSAWPQQMQIQKLAYIAHGWNLAINRLPLIEEPAEAWDNGPVFRSIWNHIRDHWYGGPHCELIDPETRQQYRANLSESEVQIIEHVWAKYGNRTAFDLSNMTHEIGTPWFDTYFDAGRNAPLDNEAIRDHYIELALAGRG